MKNQNNIDSQYTPMLKEWDVLGQFSYGEDAITQMMKNLVKVVNNGETYCPQQYLQIEGNVYGREGFAEGERVRTSRVAEINRVSPQSDNSVLAETQNSRRALISVRTRSGTCYYLYLDDSAAALRDLMLKFGMPEHCLVRHDDTKVEK